MGGYTHQPSWTVCSVPAARLVIGTTFWDATVLPLLPPSCAHGPSLSCFGERVTESPLPLRGAADARAPTSVPIKGIGVSASLVHLWGAHLCWGERWVPVSGPLSFLGAGGPHVLMFTAEQGVPVLKSLHSVRGTHVPLSVPTKCRRCPCPHPHFESGGCSSPLGAGAAPCPRSPRSSRPRWCQRGADNAASVAHQRRGLPAAGTATGPPQMKALAPRAPTSAAGARCASAPRETAGASGGTQPHGTQGSGVAPRPGVPARSPPPVTRGGPATLLTATSAHAGTRGRSGVRPRPHRAPRSRPRCGCQPH